MEFGHCDEVADALFGGNDLDDHGDVARRAPQCGEPVAHLVVSQSAR